MDGIVRDPPNPHQRKVTVGEPGSGRGAGSTTTVPITPHQHSEANAAPRTRAHTKGWLRTIFCRKRKGADDRIDEDEAMYHEPMWRRAMLACLCCSNVCLCFVVVLLLIATTLLGLYSHNVDQVSVRDRRELGNAFGKKTAMTMEPPALSIFDSAQFEGSAEELLELKLLLGTIGAQAGHVGAAQLTVFLQDVTLDAPMTEDRRVSPVALHVLGYHRLTGREAPEAEVRHPTDDVALLQWRHALSTSAADEDDGGGAERLSAVKLRLYGASSVLNRRFYHGVRRLERAAPYASASAWSTKGWYDAVAGAAMWGVYGDAGAVDADALSRVNSVRLRVDDLSKAAVAELESYEQHADVLPPWRSVRADVPSVFVSLASYRDVQCAPTLLDLFRKAKNPHRVYVGLAEQNRAGDVPCVSAVELHEASPCVSPADVSDASAERNERALRAVYGDALRGERDAVQDARRGVCFYAEHVRLRTISADVAKGPTYGRYMAMLLYRGESFTLVLDSHNRFTPFWDSLVTHQHYRYDDPKTVLSHYPPALVLNDKRGSDVFWHSPLTYLCRAYFLIHYGFVRLDGAEVTDVAAHARNNAHNQPYVPLGDAGAASANANALRPSSHFRLPQPWVAGGFLFANSSIMREVPFDPHLPQLFDGEEVLYSVRLWTHGYNIFSPAVNIAFHLYDRRQSPHVYDGPVSKWVYAQSLAHMRVRFLVRSRVRPGVDVLRVPANTTNTLVVLDADRFGTGKARSVEAWYVYAGVDPVAYSVDGRWCAPHMYANPHDLDEAKRRLPKSTHAKQDR